MSRIRLKGLVPPQKFIGVFSPDERDELNDSEGEIEGHRYDGQFYLVPNDIADAFFAEASILAKSREVKMEVREYDASAFVAIWNVSAHKSGFSLIVSGVSGGLAEDLIDPLFSNSSPLRKDLVAGNTFFEASDAHMTWPLTYQSTEKDMDWREATGELFRVMRSLTCDKPKEDLSLDFNQSAEFQGKNIVFTGRLETMSRNEAATLMTNIGANVTNSLSTKTDFLIVGADPGQKLKKAADLGVASLTEKEWLNRLKPKSV